MDELMKLRAPMDQVREIRDIVFARRDIVYEANNGARYFKGLEEVPEIEQFVRDPELEQRARELLHHPYLAYLSLSGLEVQPGEPGIPAHRDWPHSDDDYGKPHLCCQFLLSLDGTSEERGPLWIGEPENKVVLDPGDLIIYGGNVLHGVHPNTSTESRATLLWSLGPYFIRPMNEKLWSWRAGW